MKRLLITGVSFIFIFKRKLTMSRKQQTVIFLDIDGVLQHDAYRRYCLRRDWNYNWRVDPTCLLLLKRFRNNILK